MRHIDLVTQTILLALAIPFGIAGLLAGNAGGFLLIQLVVGLWQMISCFLSLLVYAPRSNRRRYWHMAISLIVIVLLIVVAPLNAGAMTVLLFGPPWILAIFYYSITWRMVFPKTKSQSKFLPHISF